MSCFFCFILLFLFKFVIIYISELRVNKLKSTVLRRIKSTTYPNGNLYEKKNRKRNLKQFVNVNKLWSNYALH